MANKNKKSGFTGGEILFAVMIAAACGLGIFFLALGADNGTRLAGYNPYGATNASPGATTNSGTNVRANPSAQHYTDNGTAAKSSPSGDGSTDATDPRANTGPSGIYRPNTAGRHYHEQRRHLHS